MELTPKVEKEIELKRQLILHRVSALKTTLQDLIIKMDMNRDVSLSEISDAFGQISAQVRVAVVD